VCQRKDLSVGVSALEVPAARPVTSGASPCLPTTAPTTDCSALFVRAARRAVAGPVRESRGAGLARRLRAVHPRAQRPRASTGESVRPWDHPSTECRSAAAGPRTSRSGLPGRPHARLVHGLPQRRYLTMPRLPRWNSGSPMACCAMSHAASAPSFPAMSSPGQPCRAISSRKRAAFRLWPLHPRHVGAAQLIGGYQLFAHPEILSAQGDQFSA
jgi:hypothetical protein